MLKTKQKLIESALAELKKEDDVLLEMANIIREEHPEIPANIFISSGRGYPHGPRIKVQTDHDASV